MSTSSKTVVSGSHRFKYFKRPIMPRVSAVPPQILLAPTKTENPMVPVDNTVEPTVKDAEVQTQYRESEAQTVPYTPDYVVAEGEDPEVLLLKNFTYDNGLPLGRKEIEMIEYARAKRDMESNLPPFTDEASLQQRKRLMEQQEMREFKMREAEIDSTREAKLQELERALVEREESKEFMTSQRLESVRLLRMEEREKVLQKIRHKRIKSLRRLAHQRNQSDPILSEGVRRDIINDYFDKGSKVYAPARRQGMEPAAAPTENFDVASRTMPLDNIGNIINLESSLPRRMTDNSAENEAAELLLAKSMPARDKPKFSGGGRAAEDRLTSAAQRALRMTKRDVEEMHQILLRRKLDAMGVPRPDTGRGMSASAQITLEDVMGTGQADGTGSSTPAAGKNTILSQLMSKKPKGRPPTPDFTQERIIRPPEPVVEDEDGTEAGEEKQAAEAAAAAVGKLRITDEDEEEVNYELKNDNEFQAAVTLLQRLIRGRAVQNIMYEGKYRRRELIQELQIADEEAAAEAAQTQSDEGNAMQENKERFFARQESLQQSTVAAVTGSLTSNLLNDYALHMERTGVIAALEAVAAAAVKERLAREVVETGRRQKDGKVYPQPPPPSSQPLPPEPEPQED